MGNVCPAFRQKEGGQRALPTFSFSVTLTQKIQYAKVVFLGWHVLISFRVFCHLFSICMSVIMTIFQFKAFKNFNAQIHRQEMDLITEYWD